MAPAGGGVSIVLDAYKMRVAMMLNVARDIHPLTDFKRKTTSFVSRLKRTRRPVVLTVNGKAELVVQDAASFQRTQTMLDRFETIEAIRRGLRDVEAGRVRDAWKALKSLQRKLGIPD